MMSPEERKVFLAHVRASARRYEQLSDQLAALDAKLDAKLDAPSEQPSLSGPPYTLEQAAEVAGFTYDYLYDHREEYGGVMHDRWRFDRTRFHEALANGPAKSKGPKQAKARKRRPKNRTAKGSPLLEVRGEKAA